jgi:methylase of polypeptide subunit release factors
MILLKSGIHNTLLNALSEAEATGQCVKWNSLLKDTSNQLYDPFLAVLNYGFPNKLFTKASAINSINNWVLQIEPWRQKLLDARVEYDVGSSVLYRLWEYFSQGLTLLLRQSRQKTPIPDRGGILAFVGGLSKCLIINYEIVGETATLHPVAVLDAPKSAFDFWGAIDQADMVASNALKTILASAHKLILHRGILIHVDRRNDAGVFGPSIDTLILSEILAQQLLEDNMSKLEVAIEIGCGNGLLTTLLSNYASLSELYAIDINFAAVSCTARNLSATDRTSKKKKCKSTYLIAGPFQPDIINRKFDLIVCNPPYIPMPPHLGMNTHTVANFFQAVAGTKLMEDVIRWAPKLLNLGGKILLMTSSLSIKEALALIPDKFAVSRPLGDKGVEVMFDVEAVLNQPDWLSFLMEDRGLSEKDGIYYHDLHPIWIEQTKT